MFSRTYLSASTSNGSSSSSSSSSPSKIRHHHDYTGHSGKKEIPKVSYFDIKVESPYEDLILIQGSPLESQPISLNGKLIIRLNEDIIVKKIGLKLFGNFKLDFLQTNNNGLTSIVKEKKKILECQWDNLLLNSKGRMIIGNEYFTYSHAQDNVNVGMGMNVNVSEDDSTNVKRTISSPVMMSRFMRRKPYSSQILEIPYVNTSEDNEGGGERRYIGTPFNRTITKEDNNNVSTYFHLRKGYYELPFNIMLPNELPETIEGLQSGSVLYNFEGHIDRRKKSSISNLMKDNGTSSSSSNSNSSSNSTSTSTSMNGTTMNRTKQQRAYDIITANMGNRMFWKYKYLRILRTLSMDNLAMQEEICVGNSWKNKLQYEISIPSRAIPIGSMTPINIKIFPFQKGYILNKISVNLNQYYSMKDSNNEVYDDEVTIFKQSMTKFGNLVENETNMLVDKFELSSNVKIPNNLKKLTQDCDLNDDLIRVLHKLIIRIHLKRRSDDDDGMNGNNGFKSLEIKANLPVLLYISPQVYLEGRLVLFDQQNGKIHFRPNEFVPIFSHDNIVNNANGNTIVNQFSYEPELPPPNYQDHGQDRLLQHDVPINAHYDDSIQENIMQRDTTRVLTDTTSAPTTCSSLSSTYDNAPSYQEYELPEYES
ncbi:Art5p NDAI_0D04250 [Naumovozyma dairenensis CBS 421]|uniref:Arrestin C-terminal-like domain-containing protein n=1 Tax=Naumovozyma dairenensis (strain ATCC 10597 / BCRC 20456 / CBS 421 / NBRC 0211 / NRRL Y-12639) TaxID=1071378 RepID=G0WAC8_NAUDC|nr:hypothetical protein NDAI_0D04250 [Naumovozyma dairenensis CBS 421]CCD24739.1 hypothetical protein NDAI_0D04250 [Naumovozyma dairenensis CBS 421]